MRVRKSRKKYGGSRGGDIAIFILLLLVGLFMLFPIYLSVIQSIKPSQELFLFPPKMYAIAPTGQNYVDLLNTIQQTFLRAKNGSEGIEIVTSNRVHRIVPPYRIQIKFCT